MELTDLQRIFVIFIGLGCALFGLGVGILIGYLIGRYEYRRKTKVWDFDKLKRSDHYHFDRKRNKTIK